MPTTPKTRPKKGGGEKHRSKQERVDDAVMGTNDSSIVSKRSVCKVYMSDEPDYYAPFTTRYIRRSPLINRGYWLRMYAIEKVVKQFLELQDGTTKVIVNLGCGYDPLPFQFWHRHASITQDAIFVDVDYPPLIGRKRDRILTDDVLRDALLQTNMHPAQPPIYIRSDRYLALGCDLRDLTALERLLKSEINAACSSFLFVAEVSVTYMPTSEADALIRWASSFTHARFCLLEQYLPQGSRHPFAQTMLRHFDKLHTPIHAVKHYPSLVQQESRFIAAGWPAVEITRNLWDLWSDDAFIPSTVRRGLDAVEPFDEWEEFALFAGHYFLLVASNSKFAKPAATSDANPATRDTNDANKLVVTLTHHEDFSLAPFDLRRFGAAFSIGYDAVAFHGGQGVQTRLASVEVLTRVIQEPNVYNCAPAPPQARMCHTITNVNDTTALLVGGRTSPSQALADCWLVEHGTWKKVGDLSPARFRHSSVRVTLPSDGVAELRVEAVMIFGGKTSDGTLLDEWAIWTVEHGWRVLSVDGPRPSARFGALICTMDSAQSWGVILGGMAPSGVVLEDFWEWHVTAAPHPQLRFSNRTDDLCSRLNKTAFGRFGASLLPFGNSRLLIGGVSKRGILTLAEDLVAISHNPDNNAYAVTNPTVFLPQPTWPLLVGTSAAAVSETEVLLAGGGAVCFSMGSFWNTGYFTITAEVVNERPWAVAVAQDVDTAKPNEQQPPPETNRRSSKAKRMRSPLPRKTVIPQIQLKSSEDFAKLLLESKPAIIQGQDIGPCQQLWDLEYLKQKIGIDRDVVIHDCEADRMTFKDKNFAYVKKPFGEFIDGIASGSRAYLRAVSSTQPTRLPTKLEDDFPAIASDFQLTRVFDAIRANIHSTPLRISGPVGLWLHYDVLANVLCQVRGSKTLHLFPPSDVKYLSYPPGGSSSNIDVLASKDNRLGHTHPHIAHLKPGDILFIPPMWSHTATPEDGVSVAVNVFFKNLENGYAAGRDVYGNRDLQAYENGRRDVERIAKAFKNIPEDITKFYLDRLAMELQGKADTAGIKSSR